PAGSASLVGQRATVLVPLAPHGRVRVLGEDWAARLREPRAAAGAQVATRVEVGGEVRIIGVDGLKLIVEPV
nr:NfeD family protein [Ktedonobacterales bacterium]